MSKDRLERYLRHIDKHGTDMIEDSVQNDRRLTDEEKAAVVAYAKTKTPPKPKRRKR